MNTTAATKNTTTTTVDNKITKADVVAFVKEGEHIPAANNLPPVSNLVVNHNRLYTTEEIAKIVGLSNSWVYQQVQLHKPQIRSKSGHRHLYGYDFLHALLTQQQTRKARVETQEEHEETHDTVIDRLNSLESLVSSLRQKDEQIEKLTQALLKVQKVLGMEQL